MPTTIRTVTDPQEIALMMLDEVRAGNGATRNGIKRLRSLLKEGEKEETRLEGELVRMAVELAQRKGEKS